MPSALEPTLTKLATYFTVAHGIVLFQLLTYFVAGRAVYALVAGRSRPDERSRYTVAYVAVGSLAWHFLAFAVLFAGIRSLLMAHLLAFLPLALICVLRSQIAFAFNRSWALFAIVVIGIAFARPGAPLLQADAQAWDEFTHWASRAKQIFIYDRLPTADDPAGCVAPYYGLFATSMAMWNYVLQGREAVGGGIAWSLLFTIFIPFHAFEYLRVHRVPALLAAPFCAWFLGWMYRGQSIMCMTMYADIFVAFGAMLALLHLCTLAFDCDQGVNPREDRLLAATGLGILLFTKSTGDVIAAAAAGYVGLAIAIICIRQSNYRNLFRRWAWVVALTLPALAIRGTWKLYLHANAPTPERLLLEQGVAPDQFMHGPLTGWPEMTRVIFNNLLTNRLYALLMCSLPVCWLVDLALRRARIETPASRISILCLWAPLVFVAFVVVFNFTFGPYGANLDSQRYMAAMLPPMLCYVVSVISRMFDWSIRRNSGHSELVMAPSIPHPDSSSRIETAPWPTNT